MILEKMQTILLIQIHSSLKRDEKNVFITDTVKYALNLHISE